MALNVLIGGGTGFIGKALCAHMRAAGHRVTVVSRSTATPGTVTWGEIERGGLPPHTDVVINLAGKSIVDSFWWNDDVKREVSNSRIHTTELLRRACEASPPRVFISSSAVGIYPTNLSTEFTEDSIDGATATPPPGANFLERLCYDWEKAAVLPATCPTRRVVIRWGVVLGREGGVVAQLYRPFWFGLGGPIGSGTQYMPWIHLHDACRLVQHIVDTPSARGVFNGVAPQQTTSAQFASAFGAALGRPAVVPTPAFAITAMLGSERAVMLLEGQQVAPRRTLDSGFQFAYPSINAAMTAIFAENTK